MLVVFLLLIIPNGCKTPPGRGISFPKALVKGAKGRQLFDHDRNGLGLGIATGEDQKKE